MPRTRYNNIDNVSTDKTLKQFRQWREERRQKKKDYSYVIPNISPDLDYLHGNRHDTSVTWVGHATFFIQYEGLNIVTDPVWAKRMAFTKRLGEPGIPITDIPPLDLILISHSHYDHLHVASIRKLYRSHTTIIVPAGLRRKMVAKGFRRVIEMHWWETLTHGGVRISFVPTQHWTRRTPFDTNTSHWGGFVLEPNLDSEEIAEDNPLQEDGTRKLPPNLYFAGDSGYFPGFKDIGRRYNIHIALMPIGAYEPEWFMTSQHVNPEEALQAFLDVQAETMIPMHYGTFKLADDTAQEALERMEAERVRLGIQEEQIRVLKYGETFKVKPERRLAESITPKEKPQS
ncbi:MBL fold metallo-hydrolase [Paenibacillus sp. F411]|uniref:N-acyl-phosphatidylethanolamine-hydrolyzing phospholipase D family protein n=1 Tax=Paenibacillus algicola TaxID=2565926 RepID=A0A4P8XN26_9BACL|nr:MULTISPECIES: MBL fold metallo-hydrolase [Paenibacillus]MBO2945549.1 MBL fold metallo-hydrolase [Paenibacillus sp. F411]QCT04267.1 N-acyl-phosphatidylethanolamine-hydrolyzing phospholipase D family protein [Paenibacillus algicola]